jgi:hypothetical protein
MGDSGAASFSNALMKPGVDEYDGMLHVFIYNLKKLSISSLTDASWVYDSSWDVDGDGLIDQLKLNLTSSDAELNEFLQQLLNGSGITSWTGTDGATISVQDGKLIYTAADGTQTVYTINATNPIDSSGNIALNDGYSLGIGTDANGLPTLQFYLNGIATGTSIPLLSAYGSGFNMGYNPSTGQLSFDNEFQFNMNPGYTTSGTGGLNWQTATCPPWDPSCSTSSKTKTSSTVAGSTNSVLAQLPSAPENPYYFALFMLVILGSITAIRVREQKRH